MGARMRAFDWSSTALGPPEGWSGSLKAAIRMMLTSRFAMWMAAGPELTFFCNDAYLPTTGNKRNWVLGARSDKVWAEIWADIGPRIKAVLETGEATWDEALQLYLQRSGYAEETYHTFSYSPLDSDQGVPAGMLCVVAEVTDRVIGERQLAMLRDLGSRLAAAATRAEVMRALEASLAAEPRDLPFALTYFIDARGEQAHLAARHGLAADAPFAAPLLAEGVDAALSIATALSDATQVIPISYGHLGEFATPFWQVAPAQAYVVHLMGTENDTPIGFFVAGLNPHRSFDASYRGFIDLVAAQLAAALARADEYDRERARARALAELDRAKTSFFANISHEFRTPLTLMLGPLEETLGDTAGLPAAQRETVELVYRNGLRLLKLVNNLLDFSRIEAGRVQATFEPTDLATMTADLASNFRSAIERAGLAFDVDCETLPQPVYVDRDMWEKIVLNLLSNAFKFTFEGRISVSVRACGTAAEIVVQDTGTGIPKREMPRLFERFHRIEGARGRSFEGSGIGLALVQELLKIQGGTVRVDSEEGRGTAFTISLPFGTAHLPPDRVRTGSAGASTGVRAQAYVDEALRWLPDPATSSGETGIDDIVSSHVPTAGVRPRVLLADDNADMRSYVSRLLAAECVVEAVGDGEAALRAIEADPPDLILTDIMMPRLDGFALLRAIRANAALRDIPVIVLSARAGEEASVEGLDAGADDYLVKPFSAGELRARVRANLSLARLRREATRSLVASEARLKAIFETVPVGIVIGEAPSGRIVEANRQAAAIFGHEIIYSPDVARYVEWPCFHADGRRVAAHEYPLARALAGEERPELEVRYRRGDGREAWVRYIAAPIRADGRITGGIVASVDIDREKRAIEALDRIREELEARVDEAVREREAAQASLAHAQRMEALGQLAGGIAHDFNNVLQAVASGLAMIRKRAADPDDVRNLAQMATDAALRGASVTARLLAFARKGELRTAAVSVPALLQNLREILAATLGAGIKICVETVPGELLLLADKAQLETVMVNLAVNARDAMPAGGTLTLAAHPETVASAGKHPVGLHAGSYVRLQMTDTGVGMDAGTLARAAEPFFTTKGPGQGTGLGLAMARGFAQQSNGGLAINSAQGHGTTVTLWFPLAGARDDQEAQQPATAPAYPLRNARLLVVDDDKLVREMLAQELQDMGFETSQAADGLSALAQLDRGDRVDLLITDLSMPGMNGVVLTREAKQRRGSLPVILLTGYADANLGRDLENMRDRGVLLLRKPVVGQELAEHAAGLLRVSVSAEA